MGTGAAQDTQQLARQEAARLGGAGVRAVALGWVDTAGLARTKAVPLARLPHVARHGVGMSPVFDVYTSDDRIAPSPHLGSPDGDVRLFPDLDRLTALAAQPGWAWAPADRYTQQGGAHPACQRLFARRMVQRAAARGLLPRMGFETEWVVLQPDDPPRPATEAPAYGLTRVVDFSDYLRDILVDLAAEDLQVLQLHPEYAAGQFEVSTAPRDPVGAADDLVLVRTTLRAVSARHGLRVSFSPAVFPGQVGNGCHLHLSLQREGADLFRDGPGRHGLTDTAEAFLAGVLDALPALMAIGAPLPASYLRLVPSHWAGVFQCWGLENREAALRLITGPPDEPDATHAEVKCFDAAANPYLVVGAVIAAGLAGVDTGLTLPEPVQGDPALVAPGTPRLPQSLTRAADYFEEYAPLREALGEVLHGAVLAVRRAEADAQAGMSPQDLTAAALWRY